MTLPKRHLPQECVLITRRTHDRAFLLEPDRHVVELVMYALALYSHHYAIKVHAVVVMSNHIHLVITDTKGQRSGFMRSFFALIARARNCQLDRKDTFWSGQAVGECVLLDSNTILDKCIYTWMNPVAAHLTNDPRSWDGYLVGPEHWDKTQTVMRPTHFFKNSTLPDAIIFTPEPPASPDLPPAETMSLYNKAFESELTHVAATRPRPLIEKAPKRPAPSPQRKPRTKDPWRKLNPEFAGHPNVRHQAIAALALFRSEHQKGREAIKRGDVHVPCMPPGTISLRKLAPWLVQRPPSCRVA